MTTYTLTEGQRVQLLDAQNIGGEHRRQLAIALLKSLQPNTQEPILWRTDKRLNGRYTHADQSKMPTFNVAPGVDWVPLHTHPAPQQEPLPEDRIAEIFSTCHKGLMYPQDNRHGPLAMRVTETRAIEASHNIGVKP